MKKLFTLLTLMLFTVAAMAADYTDKCEVFWSQGAAVNTDATEASVVDNGDGTVTLTLKQLQFADASDYKFPAFDVVITGLTGTEAGGVTTYTTDDASKVSFANYSGASYYEPSNCSTITLTAKSTSEKLYVSANLSFVVGGNFAINDCAVTYGTDEFEGGSEPETATLNYTDKCEVLWSQGAAVDTEATEATVEKSGDGTATITIKKLQFSDTTGYMYDMGDLVFTGVSATEADGVTTYTTDDASKVSFANYSGASYFEPSNCSAVTLAAKSTSEKLYVSANLSFYVGGNFAINDCAVTYGTDEFDGGSEPEKVQTTYTDNVSGTYNGDAFTAEYKSAVVTDNGDGTYDFYLPEFMCGDQSLGDVTLKGVTGTVAEDGTVNYTFDGNATIENLGIYFGMYCGVLEEQPFTMTGKSRDGKLYATFHTSTADGMYDFDVTSVFGSDFDAVEPPVEEEEAYYSGTWSSALGSFDDFTGTVSTKKNEDGTYDIYVDKFTVSGNEAGGFTIPGVTATEGEDGTELSFFTGSNNWIMVTYAGETPSTPVYYVQSGTGKIADGKLTLEFRYIGYGTSELYNVTYNGEKIDNPGTGISAAAKNATGTKQIYTIGGSRTGSLQHGINIVRRADGTTVKVIKK